MKYFIAMLLGIVQGLTEFLPVSSSGHLTLFHAIFNTDRFISSPLAYDIILHLGTLSAVMAAFWGDVKDLVRNGLAWVFSGFKVGNDPGRKLVVMLLIATCPLAIGALIDGYIEAAFSSTLFVGCALLITAVILWSADRLGGGQKNARSASWGDALLVGLSQLFAVLPGVSRSGTTMSAGLMRGFDRDFAVRFAFLLSIPAVIGSTVFALPDMLAESGGMDPLLALVGFVSSAISGWIAIKTVRLLMKKGSFRWFALYCVCAGAAAIVLSLI